ncbi:hypothetical protein SPLC1_S270490 [Arthrospira platensis C1]|nr:hypothetical protein SPLC1_S270490 [Arthrospira platensis C1]
MLIFFSTKINCAARGGVDRWREIMVSWEVIPYNGRLDQNIF